MLDIAYLRENLELARARLAHRGYTLDVETFKRLDGERKSRIQEVESLRQQLKAGSAEIGKLKREKTDSSVLQNQ
jgi:seryl-tRNA synthetase